jgi:alkanesulfonate monooxygenase SsuD/methylene tetrahydromethanopterin reductase-like flavin-dependent oxidoreductase (luciferase family)
MAIEEITVRVEGLEAVRRLLAVYTDIVATAPNPPDIEALARALGEFADAVGRDDDAE